MQEIKGTPQQGLVGATLGFFAGFASVALFGTTAARFQDAMHLSPFMVGLLIAMPSLSGSLLRVPFSAWVDTTGGRKPFLVLLLLSLSGMIGLTLVVHFLLPTGQLAGMFPVLLGLGILAGCGIATFTVGVSQVSYWFPQNRQGKMLAVYAGIGNLAPGIFSIVLPFALTVLGFAGSYLAWLVFLGIGTVLYGLLGKNAWYFQLLSKGETHESARQHASALGQELFPAGNIRDSLRISARSWRTWALVVIYFSTFGGFIALTAWLPIYWTIFHGLTPVMAGFLTAIYSVSTSLIRVAGGVLSDELQEGGENTAILSLQIMLMGAMVMTMSREFELAVPGVVLLAFGMGLCNAAVFKLVPQEVPQAVGGAAGWVGGIGAFGGFVIPLLLSYAVRDLGDRGYAIGFIVFIFLALISLSMAWVLKYTRQPAVPGGSPVPGRGRHRST